MPVTIEIIVGEMNDVEAHVFARMIKAAHDVEDADEKVEISGTLHGPFCESSRTLPAQFTFKNVKPGLAEVVVPDPCLWSPELPHVYHAEVTARQGGQIVGEFHGQIGLHRLTPRRAGIEFPG
jgi:hypothetical protein